MKPFQGVGPASRLLLKFGVVFFDYDLDGRWTFSPPMATSKRRSRFKKVNNIASQLSYFGMRRKAGEGFVLVPPEKCGSDLFKPIVGRGSAFADIDGDGDLDVVLTQIPAHRCCCAMTKSWTITSFG